MPCPPCRYSSHFGLGLAVRQDVASGTRAALMWSSIPMASENRGTPSLFTSVVDLVRRACQRQRERMPFDGGDDSTRRPFGCRCNAVGDADDRMG